jgi:protein HOOK3
MKCEYSASTRTQVNDGSRKLEDIITEKENIIRTNDSTISSLNRKIDDILPKAEMATKWKDELDEQKHMVEKLRKHHNVAEKYRKKLEGMTDLERQIKLLEEQLAKANKTLRENDETSKQLPGQRKLVDQYKKQMEKLENENAALLLEKHKLEIDNEMLRDKVSGVETQISRDMEQIQTLEEKIRDLESGIMRKDSDDNLGGGDLDSELTFTTRTKTDLYGA